MELACAWTGWHHHHMMTTPWAAPSLPRDASSPTLLPGGLLEGSGGLLPVCEMAAAAAHAAKKRRAPEEEAEEEMHLAFRGAANALSRVYTQAVAHQKASFLAGERRTMECVYRWISSQHEEASEVSVADVLAYLENEIERRAEDMSGSSQHSSPLSAYDFPSANVQSNAFSFGNVAAALNSRTDQTDLERSAGISNALPGPSQQNFHLNHLVRCSGYGPINSLPDGNGARNNLSPQNQDSMHFSSDEASMDMNHNAP